MDEILHHLDTMGNHCLLVFAGESSFQGSLGGAGFRPSTIGGERTPGYLVGPVRWSVAPMPFRRVPFGHLASFRLGGHQSLTQNPENWRVGDTPSHTNASPDLRLVKILEACFAVHHAPQAGLDSSHVASRPPNHRWLGLAAWGFEGMKWFLWRGKRPYLKPPGCLNHLLRNPDIH